MTELREAMRQAVKGSTVPIDVPEWGQKVYIRGLSARESVGLTERAGTNAEAAVHMLLVSIVDENGDRVLADDDLDLLMDQPVGVIMPLALECAKLNGLTNEEMQAAIASFGKTPGEGSSTE